VWTTWTAPDGSFTIDFPGTPVLKDLANSDPKVKSARSAIVENSRFSYGVGWFDPAPGYTITDNTDMLQRVADGAAQGAGWIYNRRELGDFAGNPALYLEGTASGVEMHGMAMISGQRVYLFVAGGAPGETLDYEGFRASFHIT
jgi:hypothetical protein